VPDLALIQLPETQRQGIELHDIVGMIKTEMAGHLERTKRSPTLAS
jgi:hypothetical protein